MYDSNDEIKERVLTIIELMRNSRAKEKLLELKALGVINKIQYDSWSKIRNKGAHAVRDRSKGWFDKDMIRYNHALELLYRIIFYTINYDGEYTSYLKNKYHRKGFILYT